MEMSHPHIIWAGRPETSRPIAELWIDENDLWFTIFIDDIDQILKIEVFPPLAERRTHLLDFREVERLIEAAKRDLLVMAAQSPSSP